MSLLCPGIFYSPQPRWPSTILRRMSIFCFHILNYLTIPNSSINMSFHSHCQFDFYMIPCWKKTFVSMCYPQWPVNLLTFHAGESKVRWFQTMLLDIVAKNRGSDIVIYTDLSCPLGCLYRRESFHCAIAVRKRHARETIRLRILAKRRALIHGFSICIDAAVCHIDNAGSA